MMRRHLAALAMAAVLAAAEIPALPASAEMPMSPVYPTAGRPKRVSAAAQHPAAPIAAPAEKPAPPVASGSTKEPAVTPAKDPAKDKDAAAGPVFEAAIPPPAAPDSHPAPPPAAESPRPAAKKTGAKPHQRRHARVPRYAYSPYLTYPLAPSGYADPHRGWGGGRYGPTPISDGQ